MMQLGEFYATALLWRPLGGTITAISTLVFILVGVWKFISTARYNRRRDGGKA